MLVNDAKQLYFIQTLTSESPPLSVTQIYAELRASEFAKTECDTEQIESNVKEINKALNALKNPSQTEASQNDEKSEEQKIEARIRLGEIVDGIINLSIQDNGMSALVKVVTAAGGKDIDLNAIKQACETANVQVDLNAENVTKLLEQIKQSKPLMEVEQIVAEGKPAKDGNDSYVRPLLTLFADKIRQHKRFADGSFDLRDLGEVETVEPGQIVAERVANSGGKNGFNVLGKELPAKPGKDTPLRATAGTQINPDNENQLIATKKGLLTEQDGNIIVDDVLVLEALDAQAGHIIFDGSVVVKGDVSAGMKLEATGEVTIGGFVESSWIKSGRQLVVVGGCSGRILNEEALVNDYAKARKAKYSCHLISDHNISVGFSNQCHVNAKFDVEVEKNIIHTHVVARSVVVGSGDAPNGKILGSYFYLSQSLVAGHIGSVANVHVDISMNRGYHAIRKKLRSINKVLRKIEKKLTQLLSKKSRATQIEQNVERIEKQLQLCRQQLQEYTEQKLALKNARESYLESLYVQANAKLMSHVKCKFAEQFVITKEDKSATRVHLIEEKVEVDPL